MAHSYSGLVLSPSAVEFSSEPCCPEVPWNFFALKFSVSRGRCGIIASMRFVSSFLLLKSGRSMGLRAFVWIVSLRGLRCPEVGVGIPNLTSGHLRRDLELHVCLYFPWGTNNWHRFPPDVAFSDFVFQCTQHTQDARDIQGGQGIQDIQDTQHARDTRRLRDARGTHRIRDAILIFKCPEVGSCFLLSGASSKNVLVVVLLLPLRVDVVRASGRRSKFRSRGPPGNVPRRASPGGLRKLPKWLRGFPGPKTPPK